ncbi:WD40 repeat-like protein [Rhizopogon salebrosus TDB-379]|nr:WD40 repeat-like protein [Rhizopogon salebrosus TDB-379]
MILTAVVTLEGHARCVPSISYLPDGKQMVSGSWDSTARRWDVESGKEIEEERDVFDQGVNAVVVSRDSRWVITAGGDSGHGELKASEVEKGIVKSFQSHSEIICVDISADSTLLASGSDDCTVRMWSLETDKLVAGPFESADWPGAIRFSPDLEKLAVRSAVGKCLEVWNLDIVGAPFKGHTEVIYGLAFSADCSLLASASADDTIKLWTFESRQLIASFEVQKPHRLLLSPDLHQLAYTTFGEDDNNIYVCNTPPDVLASIRPSREAQFDAHRDCSNLIPKTSTASENLLDVCVTTISHLCRLT